MATKQKSSSHLYLVGAAIVAALLLLFGYMTLNYKHIGKQCGGIALLQCPIGLSCVSDTPYPDGGGSCQYIWPLSKIVSKSNPGNFPNTDATPDNDNAMMEKDMQEAFCGGIANITCPDGYACKLTEKHPDAGGTCRKL